MRVMSDISLSLAYLSAVKPLALSPLEPQSSTLALELRVREVEEENRVLRKELSQPPKNHNHNKELIIGRHVNQSNAQVSNTRHAETPKGVAPGNSSDCVSQPVVDKCEVRMLYIFAIFHTQNEINT